MRHTHAIKNILNSKLFTGWTSTSLKLVLCKARALFIFWFAWKSFTDFFRWETYHVPLLPLFLFIVKMKCISEMSFSDCLFFLFPFQVRSIFNVQIHFFLSKCFLLSDQIQFQWEWDEGSISGVVLIITLIKNYSKTNWYFLG